MSLSDPAFLGFFAVVFVLFYLLPVGASRLLLLLVASFAFYFELAGIYLTVLLFVAATAYAGGLLLQARSGKRDGRMVFIAALLAVFAPLILFKYLGFLCAAVGIALPDSISRLGLPVGLSFFTFAAVGYLIDVKLDLATPERNPLRLGLFVSFFPLVTAGPIERGGRLLAQFDFRQSFSSDRALAGLRLIFIGLVLKVLFADTLAAPVAAVFGDPESSPPLEKFVAVVFFAFDLYADFAGYSLIAIGCANMLGVEVQPNFRQPFLSPTIPEFWRTWHISLSFWVRDYLFLPLRAHWRRSGHRGIVMATLLAFLILGIWHGAGWQFVALGLAFGVLAVGSIYTLRYRDAVYAALRVPAWLVRIIRPIITFILVALILVLFRVTFPEDALLFYRDIFSLEALNDLWATFNFAVFHQGAPPEMPVASAYRDDWFLIAAIVAGDLMVRNGITLAKCPVTVQVIIYNIGAALIIYQWLSNNVAPPFLYYKY